MNILLIEDVESKMNKILNFLSINYPSSSIVCAKSVESAKEALRSFSADVVLLDMSLPSFDEEEETKSGPPQPFGGREILGYMDHIDYIIPTIVITMFETFGEGDSKMDVDSLSRKLYHTYSDFFIGLVYYNQAADDWKRELEAYIDSIGIKKHEN